MTEQKQLKPLDPKERKKIFDLISNASKDLKERFNKEKNEKHNEAARQMKAEIFNKKAVTYKAVKKIVDKYTKK